jgi:hypothetical protein
VLNASTVTGNGGGNTLPRGAGAVFFFGNLLTDTNDFDPTTEVFVSV